MAQQRHAPDPKNIAAFGPGDAQRSVWKMNWEEEHKNRVASFPDDVREAHRHSSNHRNEIENSSSCGCFYCRTIFSPKRIVEWVDEDSTGIGQTALCPYCGIDSIIGDKSGYPITTRFLSKMKSYWF